MNVPDDAQERQLYYRDARTKGYYGEIWPNVGKCVFCDMRDKYVFFKENGVVMTVPLYAYIDGQIMIIPLRHVRSVKELTPVEWETMRKMMYVAKKLIRTVHSIKGMQIIQKDGAEAQSTVEHLHFQCMPFDAPDLSVWNYRQLTNTPLENAHLYKDRVEEITKLAHKFDEKYTPATLSSTDKKATYLTALRQALNSKQASQAVKTAKVGAAIIAGDRIISFGNANTTNGPMEQERDGLWVSTPTVAHAEERCIAASARDGVSLSGSTMIVTVSPCMVCSRLIVNAGIAELHYIDEWWDQHALDYLRIKDVKVVKIPYKKKGS